MRAAVALSLVFVLAAPAVARAETPAQPPAAPAKVTAPPYRLVRILPDTNQALLLDKKRGKHVLVDVGDTVGAYQVIEIDEDQVVLSGDAKEFVLVAGEATPTARLADPYPIPAPAPSPAPAPASAIDALLDPYPADVLDPYGTAGVREVEAPAGQHAVDVVVPPKPAPPAPADPKPAPVVTPVVAPEPTSFTIQRKRLDAELSDFAKIGKDVQMTIVDGGVSLDHVAADSFFHQMGLRDGDLVRKVDGRPVHDLDDAAGVYAHLGKAKKFDVEITRAGAPVTLSYRITK
jgi:type II secretory pathway component PulC